MTAPKTTSSSAPQGGTSGSGRPSAGPFIYLASQSPRRRQLLDQLGKILGARGTGQDQRVDRTLVLVVDDCRVPVLQQSADDVAAHPAEPDHTDLHHILPSRQNVLIRGFMLDGPRPEPGICSGMLAHPR